MPENGPVSFKDMCARFDVTPRTLRYYEYIELLRPQKSGRARFYGAREIARMKLILQGRHFGFSLEDIRQWLEIYEKQGTREQNLHFIKRADEQLEQLNKQIEELQKARQDLQDVRDRTVQQMG